MKLNKIYFFAGFTFLVMLSVYFFDYRAAEKKTEAAQKPILDSDPAQISYVQILKPNLKIALQKDQSGWSLLEPIQDSGNNENIDEFLNDLANARQLAVIKEVATVLTDADLREFGLDKPAAVFNFKNNLGQSKVVTVGSVKNFEGNSYVRIDSENRILIAEPVWYIKAQADVIHYREVKLYRGNLSEVKRVNIRSLRDAFELTQQDGKWISSRESIELDQNKVRAVLKNISTTNVIDYVFEGEPSTKLVKEKGLDKNAVTIELVTDDTSWSVTFNIHPSDHALYALTERPTYLVKVDLAAWETFGNLDLDQLRDRASALSFKLEEVQKIYVKNENLELSLRLDSGKWKAADAKAPSGEPNINKVKKAIEQISDLRISEFVDSPSERAKFEGKNMLILKTDKEKLVLQLNWGPSFKLKKHSGETEYYYARSHLSDSIFALEKNLVDSLGFAQMTEQEKKSE